LLSQSVTENTSYNLNSNTFEQQELRFLDKYSVNKMYYREYNTEFHAKQKFERSWLIQIIDVTKHRFIKFNTVL